MENEHNYCMAQKRSGFSYIIRSCNATLNPRLGEEVFSPGNLKENLENSSKKSSESS